MNELNLTNRETAINGLREQLFYRLLELWTFRKKKCNNHSENEITGSIVEDVRLLQQLILDVTGKGRETLIYVDSIITCVDYIDRRVNERELKKVMHSISKIGIQYPLVVNNEEKGYLLLNGYVRFCACNRLDIQRVPVIVKECSDGRIIESVYLDSMLKDEQDCINNNWIIAMMKFYNRMFFDREHFDG